MYKINREKYKIFEFLINTAISLQAKTSIWYNTVMKLTRTIKVSEQEFYDHLEQELISTIKECTQRQIHSQDIRKGLRYCKNEDNVHARMYVSILDYQRGCRYKAQIKSLSDTITLSYDTEVEKEGLKVVFHQSIESFEQKKHNKLMKMFSEGIYLGRMSDTIYDIQKKILKKREEVL